RRIFLWTISEMKRVPRNPAVRVSGLAPAALAELSDQDNERLYGKCNNPYGHGHNYTVEISVRGPIDDRTGRAVDPAALDRLVAGEILIPFGHRDLNQDAAFQTVVPTTENFAAEIRRRLVCNWSKIFPAEWPKLEKIRIVETPRNIFEIEV